ncbi:hypothetical protein [Coxiella-like endosymbiont of Rhipicephalus sanguineus]|uniref:hypothetical protein n=1 Tax=Coxiella-like endosymbiont of Rhipicephalus sanguineus TaxID=1955402 RepID=UPI00203F7A68|nr:hypothetical protein [Coxiella-like endosymbiont of Rhipicephalus sanguineus]
MESVADKLHGIAQKLNSKRDHPYSLDRLNQELCQHLHLAYIRFSDNVPRWDARNMPLPITLKFWWLMIVFFM